MSLDSESKDTGPSPPKIFTASTELTSPDGWLCHDGLFYGCTTEEHDTCANFLLNSQKAYISSTLRNSENPKYQEIARSLRYSEQEYPSRMILQAAGFALLSSNQLSETNLPDSLTFPQMEFAGKNNIAFMPLSGQLGYEDYQAFLKSVEDWEKQAKTEDLWLSEDKETFNREMVEFLKDPTGIAYFMEEKLVAKAFYETLTVGYDAQVSVKPGKDILVWRHLPLSSSPDVFLEYQYHNHGSGSYPETETFIKLVTKQEINKFLGEMKKRPAYRCDPSGDLSILK